MVWFKVDDKHHDHKKTRRALRGVPGKRRDAGAMGLWELAGSWSADNLTDGFVPTDELFRWDDNWEALTARLVDAGFWEPADHDGEPGYQFVNWDEHQPMKVDVEAKRQAARERMANRRRKPTGAFAGSSREQDAKSQRTFVHPDPTRPDPTPSTDVDGSADKPAAPKRATQRPTDFRPTQGHVDLAAELGVDLRAEWQQFCDHHDAKGSTYKDWPAALRTWIRNAAKFGRKTTGGSSRQQADADMFDRMAARAAAREAAGGAA